MGMFADQGMNKRKGGEGGIYFKPGWYLVEILRCKQGRTHASKGSKPFFAVDFNIIESDNPERRPGTPVGFMVTVDKWPDLAYGNIADFMRAALCAKLAEETKGEVILDPLKVAGTDDDPLENDATADKFGTENDESIGVKLRVFAFEKEKAQSEGVFTHHRWFVPGAKIDKGEAEKEAREAEAKKSKKAS